MVVFPAGIDLKYIDEVDTAIIHYSLFTIHYHDERNDIMASNRINRINEEIQKELSSLIRNLKDPRIQDTMISITRVETTPDLRYTKVYVSFLQEQKAADAMKGLKSAAGYLRRELGSTLNLRYTPQIMWALDDSITYGTKLLALINSLGVEHSEED